MEDSEALVKVKSHRNQDERTILIGMITDNVVVSKVAAKWQPEGLFASKWSNLVAEWCVRHHGKYGKPPGETIEQIFSSWARAKDRDEKVVGMIDRFLSSLSSEYEESPKGSEYIVDMAGRHFQRISLERLAEDVQADLELEDPTKALERVVQFERVELGGPAGINVLEDDEAIQAVFAEDQESLIEWPDKMARFFGNSFERDGFIAFLAPEKRGKTWFLMEVAWRAMLQKKRVAFFEIGDMSQKQIMRRMLVRAAGHPWKPETVKRPISISKDEETGEITVEHEERVFNESLSWQKAVRARDKIIRGRNTPYLKLSCHASGTVNVQSIQSILAAWEREGWVADVVVIDYADNIESSLKTNEHRYAINAVWKELRRLSQELHCCLVTATQADTESYDRKTLGKRNFSNTKGKNAEVTGIIGINQTLDEQDRGIFRLNWVIRREEEYSEHRTLAVAHCLALGRPVALVL